MSNQLSLFEEVPIDVPQVEIDIDYLRSTRVHICVPCYGGQITDACFLSFIKWSNACRELDIYWSVDILSNESLVTRARNTLVARFLNTQGATHLMFVDADIGWEPWHLLVLITAKKPIIGGLYPIKRFPIEWCANDIPGKLSDPSTNLLEVSRTGTGFLLIDRQVFTELDKHPSVIPYTCDINYDPVLAPYTKTYFDTVVREGRYYSEDWSFCENWRDLGGEIWVDKRVLLTHTGSYTYNVAAQDSLYSTLHRVYGA